MGVRRNCEAPCVWLTARQKEASVALGALHWKSSRWSTCLGLGLGFGLGLEFGLVLGLGLELGLGLGLGFGRSRWSTPTGGALSIATHCVLSIRPGSPRSRILSCEGGQPVKD